MVGKAIKYMRKNKNLNQEDLSNILKINQTTLSGYETERREITFNMLEKIANKCGYKIIFESENNKFQLKDLERKDI